MGRLTTLPKRLETLDTRTAQPAPKTADPHYLTPEHRRWRAAILARAGGRCEAKGCGYQGRMLYADHIVELQDGGAPLDLANGQALCPVHHSRKTAQERAKRQAARS